MRTGKLLTHVEDFLYISIGTLLVGATVALLINILVTFVQLTLAGDISGAVLEALHSLLIVLMLVEILNTVGISIRSHSLVAEPFLVVGLIAAIRRILVVTASQTEPTAEHAVEFRLIMLELGILTAMVLALVGAIYILRQLPKTTASHASTSLPHAVQTQPSEQPQAARVHDSRQGL